MENIGWLDIFHSVQLLNLLTSHSDHSPILLQCEPIQRCYYKYSFKFKNSWLKEDRFEDVVTSGWALERELEMAYQIGCCVQELKTLTGHKHLKFKEERERHRT